MCIYIYSYVCTCIRIKYIIVYFHCILFNTMSHTHRIGQDDENQIDESCLAGCRPCHEVGTVLCDEHVRFGVSTVHVCHG